MGSKYNSIKRLIELWETYEEETEKQELIHFAEWLTTKLEEKPELNIKLTKKRKGNNYDDFLNDISCIGYHICWDCRDQQENES